MKLLNKFSFATAGLVALLAFAPGSATAGGDLRLELPGLSIGVHDDHGHRYRHKKYQHKKYRHDNYRYEKSRYRKHNRRYNRDRYYDRDDHRSSRYERRRDRQRNYDDRYHDKRYYEGRSRRDYNYRSQRRVQVCPRAGYSKYYLRDSECSSHKDHFHCTIY